MAQLVEALRYKPEGRGFDSQFVTRIFYSRNPSGRTMALGLTQPLIEINTKNISWGLKVAGTYGSTSWNPQGLSRPLMDLLKTKTSVE
jgi:hypothetical protein